MIVAVCLTALIGSGLALGVYIRKAVIDIRLENRAGRP